LKISLNWIKQYIDISLSPQEIDEKLTMSGLEVESIELIGKELEDFSIAEIVEVKKHPNADKLSVCRVNDGKNVHQIVCGAPNVAVGQRVVLGLAGTKVPRNAHSQNGEPFKLEKVKIRGEVSNGMICSEFELGISDNHEGILVLNSDAPVGEKFLNYLKISDTIFEIGITPNRPDALSHIGVARDLSAILDKPYKKVEPKVVESSEDINDFLKVEILNTDACPRYVARLIKGVKVATSPEWLQKLLKSIGLRPVNNIVDVTNFVLHEIGQPLHAFDYNKLAKKKIVVRNASDGEKFKTLDGKEHKLSTQNLLICDADKGIAIAGVMGGENSEITNNTADVLLESAYFKPQSIRKTSKVLGISTDASYRFERGVDYNIQVYAVNRATELIVETAGGKVCKGVIDVYPTKIENKNVALRIDRLNFVLGTSIVQNKVARILSNLGVKNKFKTENLLECEVPSFRPDIDREIDLIEEVARIYGYGNIEDKIESTIKYETQPLIKFIDDDIRNTLVGFGFNEIITNSLLDKKEVDFFSDNPVEILNPISQTMNFMRPSLIPCALLIVHKNINVGESDLHLFEIGNVFERVGNSGKANDFKERYALSIILTGKPEYQNWNQKTKQVDFYDIKGVVENLLQKLRFINYKFECVEENNYSLNIVCGKNIIGSIKQISKNILERFDISQDVFACEIFIDSLEKMKKRELKYIPPSKFPAVKRDLAFVIDESIKVQEIQELIHNTSKITLNKIELFDIFSGGKLEKGKKNIAFSLEFVSKDNNLVSENVDSEIRDIILELEKRFNAQLRQF
jgi:phenylalanyl-tRNA synthetase beta chain